MKVRVSYTVDVSDEDRRVIAFHDGAGNRIADRKDVQEFFEHWGEGYGRYIIKQTKSEYAYDLEMKSNGDGNAD